MARKNYSKVNLTSSSFSEEKLAELRRILPEAFSENKIDWQRLRAVLGDAIDERIEKFTFTWAGKSNAVKNVLIPSNATLRPAKDESVKFNASENLFIEGDNLEVLKLLEKAYFEKVKMIYIDPPYNTGGDFVYHDNFAAPLKNYLQQTGQVDAGGNKLQTNREASGRYHSDWLSMMYPRLQLAWKILRDDGVVFVSIDDNELHHLRMLMDEVFGEENFVALFVWNSRQNKDNRNTTGVSVDHEYIVCYSKDNQHKALRGSERKLEQYTNPDNDPRGAWASGNMVGILPENLRPNCHYNLVNPKTGINYGKPKMGWRYDKETMNRLMDEDRIIWPPSPDGRPRRKVFLSELKDQFTNFPSIIGENIYTRHGTSEIQEIFGFRAFDFPKPALLIEELINQVTESEDVIFDCFAGSATTAHAVLRQNREDGGKRKFVLIQLPESTSDRSEAYKAGYKTIADIAKERIRRVIKGYGDKPQPIDDGFKVFKLADSNYPENQFEFDPEKSEGENQKAFEDYLSQAKHTKLFDDTKAIDIVYENIVKEGLSLNSKIAERKIGKNNAYFVADGERQLLVCLDKKIDEKTVSELTGKDYKGEAFICMDNALDDTAKANLGLHIELKTI